jgi:hypothetical protein
MTSQFAQQHPLAALALLLFVAALPFVPLLRGGAARPMPGWMRWYGRALTVLAIAWVAVAAFRYLALARPRMEGVDFYYFACIARDFLQGTANASLPHYAYFPGGYRYLQAAMAVFGEDLSALQYVVAGTLVANAVLCGVITARCVQSVGAGVLAALWYLMLASRFEALYGTTEPISTLFALAGLLAWGGRPLRGTEGWRRALLLGIGLGLAAWTKQQGGLAALGAGVLALNYAFNRPAVRDSPWQVLGVAVTAAGAFLIAILLEGHGLAPLRIGLGLVERYAAEGSLMGNLGPLAKQAGLAGWVILPVAFFWVAMLGSAFTTGARQEPWVAVAGFCMIAALAAAAQFTKRAYLHYALLAVPFVAIAVTVIVARAAQAIASASPRFGPFAAIAAAGLLVMPAATGALRDGYLRAWPPSWQPAVAQGAPWHESADVAADLQSLKGLVRPGEDVLVLPPRRNVIHLVLGTRAGESRSGYGWSPGDDTPVLRSPRLRAVIVLDKQAMDEIDVATCKLRHCGRAIDALAASGFGPPIQLRTMSLWRRTGDPKAAAH